MSEFEILSSVSAEQLERRTKILCTIGPASFKEETMKNLMKNGMDAARINFSYGSHESNGKTIDRLRKVATSIGHDHFAILVDLQGPKIRVGKLQNGELWISNGEKFRISSNNDFAGNSDMIPCTYPNFSKDVLVGKDIFIDDGKIQLRVLEKLNNDMEVKVETIVGGMINQGNGINMPNCPISIPILREKDRKDLKFGLEKKVDFICLSFISCAEDVSKCYKLMRDPKFNPSGYTCPIIAKIERQEAVDDLERIVKTAGKFGCGLMVARGDLAIEAGYAKLPLIQKRIISLCLKYGVTVVTATEMLMSMTQNPLPTRAEVCDVANAILDHSGVLMLSNETAMGKYPCESVKMMSDISKEVDSSALKSMYLKVEEFEYFDSNYEIVLVGGKLMAKKHRCSKCVVIFTKSGFTADKFAAERLNKPVFAFTDRVNTFKRLSLIWGIIPVLVKYLNFDEEKVKKFILDIYSKSTTLKLEKKDAFVLISGKSVNPRYAVRLVPFFSDEDEDFFSDEDEENGEGEVEE